MLCWKLKYSFCDRCHATVTHQQQNTLSRVIFFERVCSKQLKIIGQGASVWYICVQSLTMSCLLPIDRREAVLLPSLQQGFRRQVQSQGSPTDPFGCEKIPMQELLQNFLQDVSSAQAWGIWLLCSTLNWNNCSTTRQQITSKTKTKKKPSLVLLLYFSKPRRTVRESHRWGGGVPTYADFFFLQQVDFISEQENDSVLTYFSSQAVFLWLQSVSSFVQTMYSPTCAIHALFCMSRMFYMPSQCYLQCLYQCLSMPPLFIYTNHTSDTKRCIMNDSMNMNADPLLLREQVQT